MHFVRAIVIFLAVTGALNLGWETQVHAAQRADLTAAESATTGASAEEQEHSLPQKAPEIGRIGSFPITNSMLVSWGVALVLIIFARRAMRNVKEIPAGAQNFWE